MTKISPELKFKFEKNFTKISPKLKGIFNGPGRDARHSRLGVKKGL